MKDLYTFDTTKEEALKTYATVQHAYAAFFSEFGVPNYMTIASSGEMGGDLSHEVHMPSEKGEDRIVLCDSCKYAANEEVAQRGLTMAQKTSLVSSEGNAPTSSSYSQCSDDDPGNGEAVSTESEGKKRQSVSTYRSWTGLTSDRRTLVQAFYPPYVTQAASDGEGTNWEAHADPNVLQSFVEDLDLGIENPMQLWKQSVSKHGNSSSKSPRILWIFDQRLPQTLIDTLCTTHASVLQTPDPISAPPLSLPFASITHDPYTHLPIDLIKLRLSPGSPCPHCASGSLRVLKSVEVGHTFHLGTRYSNPLSATVARDPSLALAPSDDPPGRTTLQMGCHGIGVSRLLAALASALAGAHGLNWPACVAPFECVVVAGRGLEQAAEAVYDALARESVGKDRVRAVDVLLDDRADKELGWKLMDADLIGYPVVVVLDRKSVV